MNDGRYFTNSHYSNYKLVDINDAVLSDSIFTQIDQFYNGYAIASTKYGTGLIDTNGNFVIAPVYQFLTFTGNSRYLLYSYQYSLENSLRGNGGYGLVCIDGETITPPKYTFDRDIMNSAKLLKLTTRDTAFYLTYNGDIVWRNYSPPQYLVKDTMNIDYIRSTYYPAINERKKAESRLVFNNTGDSNDNTFTIMPSNGDSDSRPVEEPLQDDRSKKLKTGLSIIANPEDTIPYIDGHVGFRIKIINNSNHIYYLDSYQSFIKPIMQAMTPKGEWKDIEYFSTGWCGTGIGSEPLSPHTFIELIAPLFTGGVETRLRFKLAHSTTYLNTAIDQELAYTTYSNEFIGYINPAQFWRSWIYKPDKLSIFRR